MNTSPKAVRFDDDTLWVSLSDGRTIAAPLAWFRDYWEQPPNNAAKLNSARAVCIGKRWTKIFQLPDCWPANLTRHAATRIKQLDATHPHLQSAAVLAHKIQPRTHGSHLRCNALLGRGTGAVGVDLGGGGVARTGDAGTQAQFLHGVVNDAMRHQR